MTLFLICKFFLDFQFILQFYFPFKGTLLRRFWRFRGTTGQAGACLHTMYLLQAYQAELFGDHGEGRGCGPNAVSELCRATDLSLRAMALPT